MRIEPQASPPTPSVVRSELAEVPALRQVLAGYVAGLGGEAGRLGPAVAAGRWADVRRVAHQLRGSGGSYGFPELTRLAMAVESAVDAGRPPAEVAVAVAAMVGLIRRIEGYDPAAELA